PAALTLLAAIANDGVPVAVSLFLSIRRHLEGKRFTRFERRAAVETDTGNAQHRELHGQFIPFLAARIVARRLVDSGHLAVGEGTRIKACRIMRDLVEPETDRVL